MKATITKMKEGHLIEIEDGDEIQTFAVGKFHAVVTCLRKNFSGEPPRDWGKYKKEKKEKKDGKVKIQ